MRRTLIPLTALALAAGCAPAAMAPQPPQAPPASSSAATPASAEPAETPVEPAGPACLAEAEALPLETRVGQLFMMGVDTAGLTETARQAIASGRIGSVVLLGNSTAGSMEIRQLTAQLGSLGTADLPLLVAVDQEGGNVQRLKGDGFSTMPSARVQGEDSVEELLASATTWAEELAAAGVVYNLAPVGDVVPVAKRMTNAPIGRLQRDFGSDPDAVAEHVVAFIEGMQSQGLATSVKHFPGLGEVTTNTDFGAADDEVTTRASANLEPFRAAIAAGVDSVMVSSAVFTQIDPDQPGVFSGVVIEDLLRGEFGFDGVVIADDLGAAKAVGDVAPGDRAVRFFSAGGDLAINADPALMFDMVADTVAEAEADPAFEERVTASAARVLRLKAATGLLECGEN